MFLKSEYTKMGFCATRPQRSRHFLAREKYHSRILRVEAPKPNMISWCALFRAQIILIKKNRLALIFSSGLRAMKAAVLEVVVVVVVAAAEEEVEVAFKDLSLIMNGMCLLKKPRQR